MVHNKLISLLIFSFIHNVISQENTDGKACIRTYDGSGGICQPFSSCESAITLLRLKGLRPDVCGYNQDGPVICCGDPIYRPGQLPTDSDRVSSRKCKEYSSLVARPLAATSPGDTNSTSSLVASCDYTGVSLIPGSYVARVGEFPHMAAIGWTQPDKTVEWNCGGSLISDQFVVTAAHCNIQRALPEPDLVRLGKLNLGSSEDGAQPEDFTIAEIVIHPNYSSRRRYDDIALLRLSRRVTFSHLIRPACLWQSDNFESYYAIVTAWGQSITSVPYGDLQKYVLNIINDNQCSLYYQQSVNHKLNNLITDTQVCAGEGSVGPCQGSSGSPLQIPSKRNSCTYNLIGLVSFGKPCGVVGSPDAYTRISKYVNWIESVVWPGE